jgi:hypothetical protein
MKDYLSSWNIVAARTGMPVQLPLSQVSSLECMMKLYLCSYSSVRSRKEGRQSEILNNYFPESGLKKECKQLIRAEKFLLYNTIDILIPTA